MVHEYAPSQFLAKSMLKLEHAKELTLNIPSIVSKYFSNNEQQNKQIEELSAHIMKSETRMDKMIEKLILMFVTIIMLLSGILLLKRGPMAGDTSIFSIILFCMATAIFIAALTVKVKE